MTNILKYSPWFLKRNDGWQRFEVQAGQKHSKGLIAQLEGCTDRDEAATLVGSEIAIERSQLPEPAEGEYYWSDLIGLRVQNLQNQPVGTIEDMMQTGANDVMVIRQNGNETLIPFVMEHYVTRIDLEQGTMLVDWPWLEPNVSDSDEPDDVNE